MLVSLLLCRPVCAQLLVSFDIDGVLLYSIEPHEARVIPTANRFNWFRSAGPGEWPGTKTTFHVKSEWVELALLATRRMGARIGFFSLHSEQRNRALLSRWRVGSETALELAENRLFSNQHAHRLDGGQAPPGMHFWEIKPLSVYGHASESIIHIDDSPDRIGERERRNLLWVIGSGCWSKSTKPLDWSLPRTISAPWSQPPPGERAHVIDRHKLVRAVGLLAKTLEMASQGSSTPVEVLHRLQHADSGYRFEDTHHPSVYLRGLEAMEAVAGDTAEPCASRLQLQTARKFWTKY